MKAPSSFSLSKMKACPSSVLGKHPLSSVSAVGVTSGDNKYKQLQQQGTGTNIFAGKGTQEEVEIKINELGGGSSNLNEYNSHNGDLSGMIGMIKAVLRANGLHQKKEEKQSPQNIVIKIFFFMAAVPLLATMLLTSKQLLAI